jgi:hypothetical protein
MKKWLGTYTVNGKTFTDKIQAILEANKTNADISWSFHEDKLRSVKWYIEPPLSLEAYYKLRAEQIRNEYDYVVVMFSGGADSRNIIKTFIKNNIKIDEVVSSAPETGLKNYQTNYKDTKSENTASEWDLSVYPVLKELANFYSEIKISINDLFKNILDYKTDEWLYQSSDWIHPSTVARYKLDNLKHLKNLAEQGKKIGIVYGIDKPYLVYEKDNWLTSVITDLAVNVPRNPFEFEYPNVDIVLFYYAVDLPELMVKQAHTLARWLNLPQNSNQKYFIYDNRPENEPFRNFVHEKVRNSHYQRAIIPCIYPDIDMSQTFQAHKSTNNFMANHDNWFYELHKDTKIYQMIDGDFKLFYKNIDSKYLNRNKTGFILFRQVFGLGKIERFFN